MRWVAVLAIVGGCSAKPTRDMMSPDGGMQDMPDGARRMADGMVAMPDGASAPPTAAQLLGKLTSCNMVGGDYGTNGGSQQNIPICGLSNAVYWQASMDIDCDGQQSAQCSLATDPDYQDQTSAVDSQGNPLDAATLPYIVIPLPSTLWDYSQSGIELGAVVAVIYNNMVEYGVFGDEGPQSIIGEASYAMAQALGIDPNPSTGGVDSGVTYITFTGSSAVVPVIEDHNMATQLGIEKALALLNGP